VAPNQAASCMIHTRVRVRRLFDIDTDTEPFRVLHRWGIITSLFDIVIRLENTK
ncbi:hypothetical protein P7K49_040082, partial [Saguinus oedipus]